MPARQTRLALTRLMTEKSPIDVNGNKARGTFVAQCVGEVVAVPRQSFERRALRLRAGSICHSLTS